MTDSTTPETPVDPEVEAEAPAAAAEAANPEERIAALEAEIADLKDQMLRALADSQNTQRRAQKEVQDARAYAVERFARDLLAIADNLGRALDACSPENREHEAVKPLFVGVEMTERLLADVFSRHGLTRIGAKGETFDPNVHQAVAQFPSEHPANTVAEVMQPGYVLNGRTVRPAMVAVSLGGGQAAAPASETNDEPNEGGGEGRVDISV
jgi:molecular chaperone GrpE